MTLSYSEVAEIIKIVDSSNCDEVSLEIGGTRILIRRHGVGSNEQVGPVKVTERKASQTWISEPVPEVSTGLDAAPVSDGYKVCSPMVGTFYTRPAPDEPEFVTVGTYIKEGAPLCIIEVMKLYSTIEANRSGTVTAILAENGQMVEYGQPLFVIE